MPPTIGLNAGAQLGSRKTKPPKTSDMTPSAVVSMRQFEYCSRYCALWPALAMWYAAGLYTHMAHDAQAQACPLNSEHATGAVRWSNSLCMLLARRDPGQGIALRACRDLLLLCRDLEARSE